jgi:ribosome maturation factor RimP
MSINKKYIESEIQRIVESLGYFFIQLVIRGDKRQQIFEVFVDSEKGVTTDDCAEISRLIHEFFEPNEEIGSYRLDVSSPGVDRPLKYLKQYTKHIGRDFSVKYLSEDETKKQKGKLLSIEDDKLNFQFGKEEVLISFEKIIEAKVQISF